MKKEKVKKLLRVFLKASLITGVLVGIFIILPVMYFMKGIKVEKAFDRASLPTPASQGDSTVEEDSIPKNINKNIAIFGVDQDEVRTDTILILHFNSEEGKLKVVSIPRDTKVEWSEFQRDKAAELDRPYQYTSKITDMSSLGGIDNLRYFTLHTLESELGITIDNYAVVNLEIVKLLVDEVGGIEIEVPRRMEYVDQSQGLAIDLYEGLQTLNGEQAEGLLRWRHDNTYSEQYAEGDLGRIETQQLFIQSFISKMLSPAIYKNLFSVINIAYKNIKTDVALTEITQYVKYAKNFSAQDVSFEVLPGEAVREDLWYYIIDEEKKEEWVQDVFFHTQLEQNNTIE